MSESYERERQNNAQLDELARKVTALRGVTVDIYDNARNQEVIDSSVRILSLSAHAHLICPPAHPCCSKFVTHIPSYIMSILISSPHLTERTLLLSLHTTQRLGIAPRPHGAPRR